MDFSFGKEEVKSADKMGIRKVTPPKNPVRWNNCLFCGNVIAAVFESRTKGITKWFFKNATVVAEAKDRKSILISCNVCEGEIEVTKADLKA